MNAEMISYPNTKLMCSVNVDGAAAAVLVSEKKAKELGMQRAVRIKASVMTSDPFQERDLVMPDVILAQEKRQQKLMKWQVLILVI
jgi:acetyl-CoA acetyltransferase